MPGMLNNGEMEDEQDLLKLAAEGRRLPGRVHFALHRKGLLSVH